MTNAEREAVINEHLPLIKRIAYRVGAQLPAHVEVRDLMNAGVLGLLDAIDKFKPARQVKFTTYAEVRIRGAMVDSLRALDWAPRSLRKKARDLKQTYAELEQKLGRPVTADEVSAARGESIDDVHALVDQIDRLNMDTLPSAPDSDGSDSLDDFADDDRNDPHFQLEVSDLKKLLRNGMDSLPERERTLLSLYYYGEHSMKEIGKIFGVNESRVCQLHSKAVVRLRSRLERDHDHAQLAFAGR